METDNCQTIAMNGVEHCLQALHVQSQNDDDAFFIIHRSSHLGEAPGAPTTFVFRSPKVRRSWTRRQPDTMTFRAQLPMRMQR